MPQKNPQIKIKSHHVYICHNDVYFILIIIHMSISKQELTLPYFKSDDVKQYKTFTHTIRDGGFKLQQQDISDKHIFHNYGQGDAEISLSYGSAYLISKIITVRQDATKIKEVAVIGDGFNALMTSLQLVKRGFKVTCYMKKNPVRKQNNVRIVEPQEGLQFWYSGGYDNNDPLKHQLVSKHSYEFFKECLHSNRYQSLKWVNCYCFGPKIQQLKEHVTEYINHEIKPILVDFNNQKLEQFVCYKTILIDTALFTQQIYTELKLRNVSIVQKQFKTIDDVLSLKQKCIFNCLGMENKQIFGDSDLRQLKGCYFSLKPQKISTPQLFSLWISSQAQKQKDFMINISNKKMQIFSRGIDYDSSQNLKQIGEKILTKAYHFIKQRTIKPYKL